MAATATACLHSVPYNDVKCEASKMSTALHSANNFMQPTSIHKHTSSCTQLAIKTKRQIQLDWLFDGLNDIHNSQHYYYYYWYRSLETPALTSLTTSLAPKKENQIVWRSLLPPLRLERQCKTQSRSRQQDIRTTNQCCCCLNFCFCFVAIPWLSFNGQTATFVSLFAFAADYRPTKYRQTQPSLSQVCLKLNIIIVAKEMFGSCYPKNKAKCLLLSQTTQKSSNTLAHTHKARFSSLKL